MIGDRREDPQLGTGERLHNERRRRFWIIIFLLGLVGAAAGFIFGFFKGAGIETTLDGTIVTVGIVLLAVAAAAASWLFFVNVDEVEIADNLWGSLIGFYVYAILFPAWWALHRFGEAGEPDDWAIYAAAMLAALAAYAWRKWRSR